MAEPLQFSWGKETLNLALPADWRLTGRMEPSPLPGVPDAFAEAERSLAEPIGSPRLSELARPGLKIALVVDDGSRPTPAARILPAVLAEIQRGGATLDQIIIVPALGVHRGMTQEEMEQRVGKDLLATVKWQNPDGDDPAKMVLLGTTSRGSPVWIDKNVVEADLIVSVGCIEPHIIASFGGGYKNLIPGVAGRATIAHNHALNCQPATFNMVGQPIENNPMRQDLEEGAKMLKGRVFIVNAVLNAGLEVVKIVSGDPIAAHRAGTQVSASIYGVRVPGLADVVITASHPMDQDLRQGVKALANTIRALKPGGVMITLVRAEEGVGVFGLANKKLPVGRGALNVLAPVLLPLVPKLKLKGMGEEDRFFLYFALQAMRRGQLLLYAPTIPTTVHENMVFVEFVNKVEDAITLARKKFPGKADVLVFPHGGSTYPILPR